MAQLYLVRHAKAGERRLWKGDDIDRPLSRQGWKQSDLLAKRLSKLEPSTLLSSPYVRCVQTLEPLADRIGAQVEIDARLAEDEPLDPVLELLADAPDGTVLCSHGDIIPAAIQRLATSGTDIRTPTDWRKATVWVLKRDRRGKIVHATVRPPPAV